MNRFKTNQGSILTELEIVSTEQEKKEKGLTVKGVCHEIFAPFFFLGSNPSRPLIKATRDKGNEFLHVL